MNSMKKRMAIVIVAIAIIAGMLACGTGGLIGRQEVTPTATKTPKPTFTATPVATDTPIPTFTPQATNTPTPIPATNTPIVLTATPTEMPTVTPTATVTPTPTKKPTAKPKPKPTNTPIPAPTSTPKPAYEFRAVHQGNLDSPNCGSTGIKGTVYNRSKGKMSGVYIAVWADGWEGTVSDPGSNANGEWNVLLNNVPAAGNWHVRAVDPATCAKKSEGAGKSAKCTGWRSDEIVVSTTDKCNGAGAIQWAVVDMSQN
jgi:hypothetical protein